MSVVNITTESELDGITSLHKLVAVCFRASWSAPCECLDLDGLAAATNGIAVVGQVDLDDDTDALQDTYEVAEKLPHWIVLRDGKRVPDMDGRLVSAELIIELAESETSSPVTKSKQVPITFLAGFLGTGKTTLLTHILRNKEGLRLGVIVNDMAKMNIDAKVIGHVKAEGRTKQSGKGSDSMDVAEEGDPEVIALDNGCVCCSLRDDLIAQCNLLASRDGRPLDGIVVEGSGIAEPLPIAIGFVNHELQKAAERKYVGKTLVKSAPPSSKIDTLVTVVDSERFLSDYKSCIAIGESKQLVKFEGASDTDTRKVVKLLVDQVECANVIVLNKSALVSSHQLDELKVILSSLNEGATQIMANYGKVELSQIIATGAFSNDMVTRQRFGSARAGAFQSTLQPPTESQVTSFIKSFLWTPSVKRPMHPGRVADLQMTWLKDNPNILRSKGWVWIATRTSRSIYWSQAGNYLKLQWSDGYAGETEKPTAKEEHEHDEGDGMKLSPGAECDWQSEIILIGMGLDQASISSQLR